MSENNPITVANTTKKSAIPLLGFERFRILLENEAPLIDPIAKKAFKKTGQILGKSLANTVAHISPEAIFLFGGLALAGKWIFDPTKKAMENSLMGIYNPVLYIYICI